MMSLEAKGKSAAEVFRCTFRACTATFDSKALLQRHKINKTEHDYCMVCDEDFDDYDSFHRHKVRSERHVCCPSCGEDFRSMGGLKGHVKQVSSREAARW